jgi:hypothetical protein
MDGRLRSRIRAALTSAAILLPALAVTTAASPLTASASTTRMISASGTANFISVAEGNDNGVQNPEARPSIAEPGGGGAGPNVTENGGGAAGTGEGGGGPHVNSKLLLTFQGLNHRQQRLANGGNQFSLEPPDQGLCVGNGFVLETVNDVLRVFDYAGNPLSGVVDLNTFYGYPPAVKRTMPRVFGPFVTDPSCYYDPTTQRWFHVVLTLDIDSKSGRFLGPNHLDIAVSQTSNPTGAWTIYRLPVQDDGSQGTPDHGCTTDLDKNGNPIGHGPCLGDYPHLGLNANAFFVTTNEYSFFGFDYHGAQVYAFSKKAIESGAASVAVTQFDTHGLDNGNSGFTLAPATSPNSNAGGRTEWFLSSNAADEAHGNGVAVGPRTSNEVLVWRLNTSSIDRPNPDLDLSHDVVNVKRYAAPPPSDQKVGSAPLKDCLNDVPCATFLNREPDPFLETEYALDSSDTRMLQTTFAAGKLWGALDTILNGKAGIEFFEIRVGEDGPDVARNGFLGLTGQNLTYPAIGVTKAGVGVVAFTVAGSNYFPSAGYANIDGHGVGAVQVAKAGKGPADGFSGYKYYGNPPGTTRPRWGDYGATAVVGNTVWIASEMINQTCTLAEYESSPFGSCGGTRTALANWSTEITSLTVTASQGGDD